VSAERVERSVSLLTWVREKIEDFGFVISKTERRFALTLLLPAIVILALVGVFPSIYCAWLSFTNHNLARAASGYQYIGFDNWREVLRSPYFWNAFWITIQFVVVAVCIELVLGLGIADILIGIYEIAHFRHAPKGCSQ